MHNGRVSYLFAQDPSIVTFNGPTNYVPNNLHRHLGEDESTIESTIEQKTLPIYLRIKNGYQFSELYDIKDKTIICKIPPGSKCLRNVKVGDSLKKSYSFSTIFSDTNQLEIFNSIVKPKLIEFINGRNCSVLTYGASGSGKTFTINGTSKDPGLIPRTLEYLFRTLPKLSDDPIVKPLHNDEVCCLDDFSVKQELIKSKLILTTTNSDSRNIHLKTYQSMRKRLSTETVGVVEEAYGNVLISIWVSFAEIYNEHVYDLLLPEPQTKGKKRAILQLGCCNGTNYIKNLTSVCVKSGIEAYQVLQRGLDNLIYAPTNVNSHSSRSHSIFTIKLVQVLKSQPKHAFLAKLNFCDLAGCERLKKTLNVGTRLRESNNINSSLLVLSRCIHEVRASQKNSDIKRIPFRESKLTQLFQKALSGLEDISMIVTINPSADYFDETQHVLNFAAIAKEIEHHIEVKPRRPNRFSRLCESTIIEGDETYDDGTSLEQNKRLLEVIEILKTAVMEEKKNTEETKSMIIAKYKSTINQMVTEQQKREDYYMSQIEMLRNRNLTSSGDGSFEDSVIVIDDDELAETTEVRGNHVEELKSRVYNLEAKNLYLEENYKQIANERDEVKATLNDAIIVHNELKEEIVALQKEITVLNEKNGELEREREVYKREVNEMRRAESESD